MLIHSLVNHLKTTKFLVASSCPSVFAIYHKCTRAASAALPPMTSIHVGLFFVSDLWFHTEQSMSVGTSSSFLSSRMVWASPNAPPRVWRGF